MERASFLLQTMNICFASHRMDRKKATLRTAFGSSGGMQCLNP
jgi:hypothetical protein